MISRMRADIAFVSPKAVREDGAYCSDERENAVRRLMIKNAGRAVLLSSLRKLGANAAFKLCELSDIDDAIFQDAPGETWNAMLAAHGVAIH